MGVMPCSRTDCTEILCHMSLNGRRICRDCLNEFEEWSKEFPEEIERGELCKRIGFFFGTSKRTYSKVNTKDEIQKMIRRDE